MKTKNKTYTEIAISLIIVVTAIKLTRTIPVLQDKWYLPPAILATAALIPTLLRKQNIAETLKALVPLSNFSHSGNRDCLEANKSAAAQAARPVLQNEHPLQFSKTIHPCKTFSRYCHPENPSFQSIKLVTLTSVITLPLLFIALLVLRHFPMIELNYPEPPQAGNIISWLIFQFLYVAVSEEIYFRAYFQTNVQKALTKRSADDLEPPKKLTFRHWSAIFIASSGFAAAHMVINADPSAVLVFIPSMIFGWLFAKTNSLLAPILFHGISNTAYCLLPYLL